MMNPLDEKRPLAALGLIGVMAALCWLAYSKIGIYSGWTLASAFLLVLPAATATLGVESSLIKAINPLGWIRLIVDLGASYGLLLAILVGMFFLIRLLGMIPLALILQLAVVMFGALASFSALAGLLYENRERLGLYAWNSPERHDEAERRERHRQDERDVTEAYGLSRAGRHVESWQMLQRWLQSRQNSPDAYAWLTGQVDLWEDPRYGTRLTEDLVTRLLSLKRPGDALRVVMLRLQHDPLFRPKSAAHTLELAQIAVRGGGSRATARTLLSDFAQRFPGDPSIDRASQLGEQLR